jgi:hypothetical protein
MAPVEGRGMSVGEPHEPLAAHDSAYRRLIVVWHVSGTCLLVMAHRHPLQNNLSEALRVEWPPPCVHKARDAKSAGRTGWRSERDEAERQDMSTAPLAHVEARAR